MTITVINPGLQTTLQGSPYLGHRHIGMPAAGAADCLSLCLANKLVGNGLGDLALEITLNGAAFEFKTSTIVALTGAVCEFRVNGKRQDQHRAVEINVGDTVSIGKAQKGCRSYLSISGSFDIAPVLGGRSTYHAAKIGGHEGRALKLGDMLDLKSNRPKPEFDLRTPEQFIPTFSDGVILRTTVGPEYDQLSDISKRRLFAENWKVDDRMNRMGIMLDGPPLEITKSVSMLSAPVFSGTVQCPPNGSPFLLAPDAQTTGGYPRIAQVIRADRHLIGQLKPGSRVQFVRSTLERATKIYHEKLALLKPWLDETQLW